jgi:hypothetical protein
MVKDRKGRGDGILYMCLNVKTRPPAQCLGQSFSGDLGGQYETMINTGIEMEVYAKNRENNTSYTSEMQAR